MDIADKYTQAYRELSQEVHDAGLIQRRYWLSWAMIVGWTLTLAALIVLVFILGVTWFQLLMAAGIGAVMAQLGLLAHDAAHRQLFASRRWNEWTARIIACLLVGISYGWWMNKHNSHHGYPNQVGKDPDIDSRVLAFTPEATDRRTGLRAKLAKRQGWFFIPLLFLEGLNLQAQSLKMRLTKPKVPYRVTETLLILVRHTAYFVLIFTILPLGMAFTSFGLQVGFFRAFTRWSVRPEPYWETNCGGGHAHRLFASPSGYVAKHQRRTVRAVLYGRIAVSDRTPLIPDCAASQLASCAEYRPEILLAV